MVQRSGSAPDAGGAAAAAGFDFGQAFSRSLGWITQAEQQALRGKRVAIAGLGGVGGSHLLTLARLGLGAFHLADFDCFELANFNRQAGATLSHLNQPKVEVLASMALDINPTLQLRRFGQGVTADNIEEFLEGVDVYVDSLDFFAVDARRLVFAACARRGIPAVTAAPLGMGAALLCFLPGHMTFEEYFRLAGQPRQEQLLRFLLGLSPAMLQRGYLVDRSRVNFQERRGPSTPIACDLCAGMASTAVLKILLKRGRVPTAPHGVQFDAYRDRLARTWRPGGNRNPLQRIGLWAARRLLGTAEAAAGSDGASPVERLLDQARWAPSGDNTQPWRFQILDQHRLVLHGRDTRDHVVYDLRGRASQMALGALLETLVIAASGQGLRASFVQRLDRPETRPTFDVFLDPDAEVRPDPLAEWIPRRATQRRAMSPRALSPEQRRVLESAVGQGFSILWRQGTAAKWAMARLLSANAHIRLTIPEAYAVHRQVIQWRSRFSEDRLPDQALGADPLSTRFMEWAMKSWSRVDALNRYAGGTVLPRVQLDLLPAMLCGAHFFILADKPPRSVEDYVAGGRAMQRFWLTAASLGLGVQPEMTPLIFASYVREGVRFTQSERALAEARALAGRLEGMIGGEAVERAVFLGRIGRSRPPRSRSLRLPLSWLLTQSSDPR